jgi:cytochrome d ubiquinol oxidase subunit II
MDPTALQIVWFLLFGLLITGYAILDGFDLGIGVISLFRKDHEQRRLMINAIAPVWDGNEVWLITAGGALFAAFPIVYATTFSSFYLAMMLVLLGLIFRAVSMEFRGKIHSATWRTIWDRGFGIGSLLPALLFGVAVGNIMRGLPLDETGLFTGNFLSLLHPYALLIGLLGLAMFVCQGAIYMGMKCDGELREDMRKWASRAWMVWVVLYVAATIATFFAASFLFDGVMATPVTWIAFIALLGALVYMPIAVGSDQMGRAFIASSTAIAAMISLVGVALYPRLVPSLTDLAYSLTIANSSSTPRTLTTMLVIALLGMPLVLAYTFFIYRTFKGKVEITEDSY